LFAEQIQDPHELYKSLTCSLPCSFSKQSNQVKSTNLVSNKRTIALYFGTFWQWSQQVLNNTNQTLLYH